MTKQQPASPAPILARPGYALALIAVFAGIVALAWLVGEYAVQRLDRDMRAQLLNRAIGISRAINPELAVQLSFTSADAGTPAFNQIRRQMIAMAASGEQRGIYSMALRDGKIVFGPESYAESDPMASAPGTVFEQPSFEDLQAIETGTPATIGPYTDEYGIFVSALAPVIDPQTGSVVMVVAIDVLADDWQASLSSEQRRPLYIAGVLLLVAVATLAMRRRGLRISAGRMQLRRLLMVPVVIIMFLSIALYLFYGHREFYRLQQQAMTGLRDQFRDRFNQEMSQKSETLRTQARYIAGDAVVCRALQVRDRAALAGFSGPLFESLRRDIGLTHLNFIGSDFTFVHRAHHPEFFGDRINRRILAAVHETDQDAWGFESGFVGCLTWRYVRPVRCAGSFVGYIELGIEAETTAARLARDMGIELLVVADKMYVSREAFERGRSMFGFTGEWNDFDGAVILQSTLPDVSAMLRSLPAGNTGRLNDSVVLGTYNGRRLMYGSYSVSDSAGRPLVRLFLARDITADSRYFMYTISFNVLLAAGMLGCIALLLWSLTGSAQQQLQDIFTRMRESESLFRALFENALSGVALHEVIRDDHGDMVDFLFLQANPAFEVHTGVRVTDVLGKRATDVFPFVRDSRLMNIYVGVAHTGEPANFEEFVEPLQRYFNINAFQLGPERFATVFQDITERKQAEAALRENREMFSLVLDNVRDAIITVGRDSTVMMWNHAAEQLYGYTRQEALGRDFSFILPEALRARHREGFMSLVADPAMLTRGLISRGVGLKKDGSEFLSEISTDLVTHDALFLVVIVVRDITQRVRADEELRRSREKFLSVFNSSPVSMTVVDQGSTAFIDCNMSFEKLSGYSREEIIGGKIPQEVLFPDGAVQLFDQLAAQKRRTGVFETGMNTRAGRRRTVTLSGAVIELDGRDCLLVCAEDVTERREMDTALSRELAERCRMQSELVANKNMLEQAQQLAHMGVWVFDLNTQKFTWSDEAYRILGIKPGTPMGYTDFSQLVHPDDFDVLAEKWAAVSGETVSMESDYRIIRPDGELRYIHEYVIHHCAEDGHVVQSAALMQDVTEYTLADQHVRQLSWAVEQSPALIVITDTGGSIQYVNPRFCETTGYAPEEVIGKNPRILKSGETSPEVYADLWQTITAGGQWRGEFHNKKKNGELYWEGASISAIRDARDCIVNFLAVKEDITERKRAEDDLKAANRDLEQAIARANEMAMQAELANMTKSEFLANMSHEIRTPMNGVIGMTGLLLDSELTNEQRQYANIVRSCGESLLALINEILDLSKIEAGKFDLEELDFDLRATMEDTAELLWVKAAEKEIELVCMVDPDVPVLLQGDPGRLRQLFMNLGGNAIKFTERGSVALRAMLESEEEDRVTVRFTVTDTGIGIPRNKHQEIFSPFTQVDGSTTRKYGGTGLGLTISKRLAELMGGDIGLESRPGHGTTFWFTAVFVKQPPGRMIEPPPMADLTGVRVLVVDDHVTNRFLVTTLLQSWGCRFAEASDADTALERLHGAAAQNDPYRIALLDMQMAGMNGAELGRCIRQSPDIARTHLIMMTSLGQRGDAVRFKAEGFEGYLNKPLRQAHLHDCMAMVLGKAQAREGQAIEFVTRHTISEARKQRVRILVAEDNATNQIVALKILEKLGYRADAVSGGAEALDALRATDYDIVLMDCQMPDMDGFEATRRIRSKKTGVINNRVPVIAMTAHAMYGDREKCLEAGMDDYLSKPVEPAALAAVLERWLNDRDSTSENELSEKPRELDGDAAVVDAVPVFVRSAFQDRLMGDEDVMKMVIGKFISEFDAQRAQLESAAQSGDTSAVLQLGHKIKGAAANLSAEALRAVASEIEQAGKAGDIERVRVLVPELGTKFEQLHECFRNEGLAE
jgi:PAS domain S-box-containing protein